nr:TetR family transcriptional regulator C-terminal domain-containing protein [Marinicella sp. W31]MDC2878173.1 TetR family transcriptional regulator C-terminal domain-containing protein [Marinicella sp. W31]
MDEKAKVIRAWQEAGKLRKVDPYHMIFSIWATTQHYADFDAQVQAVLGEGLSGKVASKMPPAISRRCF